MLTQETDKENCSRCGGSGEEPHFRSVYGRSYRDCEKCHGKGHVPKRVHPVRLRRKEGEKR